LVVAAPAVALAQGDAAKGEKRFEDCAACHSVKAGENLVGPTLFGIVNRKAAEIADYRYSPAMRRSAIVWSAKALDDFLADPQKAVPANRMPYAGLPDAAERADLIAYLQRAAK
jgi:cytochrome c